MILNFHNKNVPDAHFKIMWGNNKSTPDFTLRPGDIGGFDLQVFNKIPNGSPCSVYAWTGNNGEQKAIDFQYVKGQKIDATFNYFIDQSSKTPIFTVDDFDYEVER